MKRKFRGITYNIHVLNPSGVSKGIKEIVVDGEKISSNLLTPVEKRMEVDVKVTMG